MLNRMGEAVMLEELEPISSATRSTAVFRFKPADNSGAPSKARAFVCRLSPAPDAAVQTASRAQLWRVVKKADFQITIYTVYTVYFPFSSPSFSGGNMEIVSFISQKGGVGKSSLARLLAVHAAHKGLKVMIADFDLEQLSCVEWSAQRLRNGIEPEIDARPFKSLKKLRKHEAELDMVIVDTRGLADELTEDISAESDLVFLPTGTSLDDLRPTLALARKLGRSPRMSDKIHLILSKVGRSDRQLADARAVIEAAGFPVLSEVWPHRDGFAAEFDAGRAGSEAGNPYLKASAESVESRMFELANLARRMAD